MTFTRRVFLGSAAASAALPVLRGAEPFKLFIGAYTSPKNPGITVADFDPATGTLSGMKTAAEIPNPTFLAIRPDKKFLYAINEVGNWQGQKAGSVSAYSIDRGSGKLTLLNQVSSKGPGPCYVATDHKGECVMIANYGGGSVASYKVEKDGKLSEAVSFFQDEGSGPVKGRQSGPHAHSINPSPRDKFAVAADLGTDSLYVYKLDAKSGKMEPNQPPFTKTAAGAGPRHFTWHPNGHWAYCINELNSTLTEYEWDERAGTLKEMATVSTLPPGFTGQNSTAEVRVHPSGQWVYGSNRGAETIASFAIGKDGKLTPLAQTSVQGQMPRNFNFDPTGRWLLVANQKTDNIVVLEIDLKTGEPKATSKGMTVGAPVCLRFLA